MLHFIKVVKFLKRHETYEFFKNFTNLKQMLMCPQNQEIFKTVAMFYPRV